AFEELARSDEVHDGGLQIGEGRPGQAGAAEDRVDRAVDLLDDRVDRGLVEQVERDRRLDRRRDRLHVERGDVRTELVTDARHLFAHAGRGAGDDRVLAFVSENVVHWTETNYAVGSPPPGYEGCATWTSGTPRR